MSEDPRDPNGPFHALMQAIQICKEAHRCEALTSRGYYFEPNPVSCDAWRSDGLYTGEIDRRVVFVCESPGPQFQHEDPANPGRCWSLTSQDERFLSLRRRFGFEDCYITNTVKCGTRPPSQSHHPDKEVLACASFLIRELDLIRPSVAVCMGANAYRTVRELVVPIMTDPPVLFEATHYSARQDVWVRWNREFAELKRLLDRLKPRDEL